MGVLLYEFQELETINKERVSYTLVIVCALLSVRMLNIGVIATLLTSETFVQLAK